MNKREVIIRVSAQSGVDVTDCQKVLDALENVLDERLSGSKGMGGAFDKAYRVMGFFYNRKHNKAVVK